MSVLMSKKKAEALRSVERDRHLLTDKAAAERVLEAEPEAEHGRLKDISTNREWQDFRMRMGK